MEWLITTPETARAILSQIPWDSYTDYSHDKMCYVTLYKDLDSGIPMIQEYHYRMLDKVDYYINGELL